MCLYFLQKEIFYSILTSSLSFRLYLSTIPKSLGLEICFASVKYTVLDDNQNTSIFHDYELACDIFMHGYI